MSEHFATIRWTRNQAIFTDARYSREHIWQFDGGLEMSASASPHNVLVPYANPAYIDPEEAFIASLSSCHMLWFLAIAAKQKFVVERYTDQATGLLEKNEDGKMSITEVRLCPLIDFAGENQPSDQQIQAMHEAAHDSCFLANSVKANVTIESTIKN